MIIKACSTDDDCDNCIDVDQKQWLCIFSVNSDPVEFKLYMVVVHGKDGQNVFCGDVCRLGKNFNTDSCMSSFNVDCCTCCKWDVSSK